MLQLISFLVFLILIGFAAVAETTLSVINRARLKEMLDRGVPRSEAVRSLMEDPRRSLAAILLLGDLGLVGATATGVVVLLGLPAGWVRIALAVVGLVLLLGVQTLAKMVANHNSEKMGALVAGPIDGLVMLLSPLLKVVDLLGRPLGSRASDRLAMREEELQLLLDVGPGDGIIEADEKEMIASIFEMGETTVREVMVPRIDIVAIEADTSLREALDVIIACGHSRIPVYQGTIDNVVGLLYAKDLLRILRDGDADRPLRDLLRPAYFIPESKRVDDLLRELQQMKVHMAIVVDEYGGVAGLVTIEDLLEEIVGEIQDEYDFEEPISQWLSDYEVVFDARVDLDDVNREMDLELPTDESDTLGGLIYAKLGRMPTKGDEVRLDGVRLLVLSMKGHRIGRVKIVKEVPSGLEGAEVSLGQARTVKEDDSETERGTEAWAGNYQSG